MANKTSTYSRFAVSHLEKECPAWKKKHFNWESIIRKTKEQIRLQHLALRTEKTYLHWLQRFSQFCTKKKISQPDESALKEFLTFLSVQKNVSASTQNQAFNALLFMYRNVLHQQVSHLQNVVRAKRKRKLPVVLSWKEIETIFSLLPERSRLICQTIYGAGLRLNECLSLRIKDLDFSSSSIVY